MRVRFAVTSVAVALALTACQRKAEERAGQKTDAGAAKPVAAAPAAVEKGTAAVPSQAANGGETAKVAEEKARAPAGKTEPAAAAETKLAGKKPEAVAAKAEAAEDKAKPVESQLALAQKSGCLSCHSVNQKRIGPAYQEVAKKYQGDRTAAARLVAKVKNGGVGVWGQVPMPPNKTVSDEDVRTLVKWILAGAK